MKSDYCLEEFDLFRRTTSASIDEALRRTYIIVLDQKALRRLRDVRSNDLPLQRRALWDALRNFSSRSIRKEDLLDGDRLLPVLITDMGGGRKAAEPFHSRCRPLALEFARKLIQRRALLQPPRAAATVPTDTTGVVLGVVPRRLEGARAQLKRAFGDSGVAVLEEAELRDGLEAIRSRLADAQLFILPYDRGEVLAGRGDRPGGHLAVQQALFEECRQAGSLAAGARLLWWEPVESPAASGASGLAAAAATALAPTPGEPPKPIDRFDAPFLAQSARRTAGPAPRASSRRRSAAASGPFA